MDYRIRNARGEFMRDRARRRDMRISRRDGNYEGMRNGGYGRDRDYRQTTTYTRPDYERNGRDYQRYNDVMDYANPLKTDMRRNGDYNNYDYRGQYDYANGQEGNGLDEYELKDWHDELLHKIPEQYKNLYSVENIEKVAKQMQVDFNDYSPLELAVTATMLASDYKDVIAPSDIQKYTALAKAWICDEDTSVQYGEKLSVYYDEIVNG